MLCLPPVPQRNEIELGNTIKLFAWQTNPPVRQASLRSCLSRHSFSDGGSRTTKRGTMHPPCSVASTTVNPRYPPLNKIPPCGKRACDAACPAIASATAEAAQQEGVLCTPCSVASTTVNPRYPPLNKIPPCREQAQRSWAAR